MPSVDLAQQALKNKRMDDATLAKAADDKHLSPTQYEVLELIYQFKVMRSHHIAMHLPHRHYRGLRHSLRILTDHGLLMRKKTIYHHAVYWLSPKGKDKLAGRNLPPRFLFLEGGLEIKLNREWDHSMMTIDLLSNLVAGAREAGIRPISAEEIFETATVETPFIFPRLSEYTEKQTRQIKNYTVVPDGVIGFEYPDGQKAYFSIEAEHNKPNQRFDDDDPTSTQSSTNKKFKQYRDIDWRKVYGNLSIGNMRVLVVAPTREQIINKFTAGLKVTPESHLFLGGFSPVVDGTDVPIMPNTINGPWLRIGLPEEHINAPTLKTRTQPS